MLKLSKLRFLSVIYTYSFVYILALHSIYSAFANLAFPNVRVCELNCRTCARLAEDLRIYTDRIE